MANLDKNYAEALYELLEKTDDAPSVISSFLKVLQQKSLIHRADKIIKEFENIYNKKNNIAKLKIKSAYELDQKLVERIAKTLGINNYELEIKIDKELIGGFVAQYNDNLMDLSFKNNLKTLKTKLSS